jgi:hypothetical protein
VTQFNSRLRRALEAAALKNKWVSPSGTTRKPKSPRYHASQVAAMDFPSGQQAWSEVAGNRKRFVTKLSTWQLHTGQRMHQYGFWKSELCPLCMTSVETTEHVLDRSDTNAVTTRVKAVETRTVALRAIHTAPNIAQCFLLLIRQACLNEPLPLGKINREEVRLLVGKQLGLGHFALIQGRLCKGWSDAQQLAVKPYFLA